MVTHISTSHKESSYRAMYFKTESVNMTCKGIDSENATCRCYCMRHDVSKRQHVHSSVRALNHLTITKSNFSLIQKNGRRSWSGVIPFVLLPQGQTGLMMSQLCRWLICLKPWINHIFANHTARCGTWHVQQIFAKYNFTMHQSVTGPDWILGYYNMLRPWFIILDHHWPVDLDSPWDLFSLSRAAFQV